MKRILIALCAFAAILGAQAPPDDAAPGPRRAVQVQVLKDVLGLSDAQIQQLVELRRTTAEANQSIRGQMRTQQQALQELREAGNPDPTAVGQIVAEMERLREEIRASQEKAHEQAVNLMNNWGLGGKLEELQAAAELVPAIGPAQQLGLLAPPEGRGIRARAGAGAARVMAPRRGGRGPGPGGPPPAN